MNTVNDCCRYTSMQVNESQSEGRPHYIEKIIMQVTKRIIDINTQKLKLHRRD